MLTSCAGWDDSCIRSYTEEVLTRAFRRPPTATELEAVYQVYADAQSDSRSFESAVAGLLEATLLSPQFLFFGAVQVEAQRGLADRLAYLLTNSPPDAELLAAVEEGRLMGELAEQTRRLFKSDEGARAFGSFLIDFGLIDRAAGGKDPALYPDAGVELLADQREEFIRFAAHVVQQEGATLEALFTSSVAFPNQRIANSTGMPMGNTPFEEVQLEPEQGVGLLTRPAVLAAISGFGKPSIVRRGVWVRSQLLCKGLEPPPFIPPIEQMEGETEEEAFDRHKSDPACSGCHQLIDPIGEGFAAFDSIGRWDSATTTRGEISSVDASVDGEFTSVRELAVKLASTDLAKDCMAVQWYRHAVARLESKDDDCEVLQMRSAMRESGSLEDMIVAYTTNPGFVGSAR